MERADPGRVSEPLHIEIVFSPAPRQVVIKALTVDAGTSVRQALEASGLLTEHQLEAAHLRVGIWGRATSWQHPLRDRDRVEIYRPLKADPKESRRLRYKKQRPAKKTGR